ncbi:MAG: hypothetical protein QM779_13025 [Propionicimonas sp.]|uniref:hypothetical protein n=1 Tax=Propionicimonas sp. TaxID=1955623 RepID=UPI003D11BCF9
MRIQDEYVDALIDELAPFGFEFDSVTDADEGVTEVVFEAEPESFIRSFRGLGIEESYGDAWPPASLELRLAFDEHGDPVEIEFEVFDLLLWTASTDPELHARLSSMEDPEDHAIAVGEALREVLTAQPGTGDDFLE